MFAEEHPDADSEITDLLRFQTDQVSRLASLVRTLLEMSDLQSIQREDHIELAPLADEIVADLTPLAQRRSITLFQECEDVSIKGSDTLIYRLLFNLVENGIKYNTPGGSVHITIRQKKSSAVLRVADTGCGIPEEHRYDLTPAEMRVLRLLVRGLSYSGSAKTLCVEPSTENTMSSICCKRPGWKTSCSLPSPPVRQSRW